MSNQDTKPEPSPLLRVVWQTLLYVALGGGLGLIIAVAIGLYKPDTIRLTYEQEMGRMDQVLVAVPQHVHDAIAGFAKQRADQQHDATTKPVDHRDALQNLSQYIEDSPTNMSHVGGWRQVEVSVAPMVGLLVLRYILLVILVIAAYPLLRAAWAMGRSTSLDRTHQGNIPTGREHEYRYNEWKCGILLVSASAAIPYPHVSSAIVMPVLVVLQSICTYRMRATMAAQN